jgi:cytochrome c-type biogenesis protein CcmH
MIGWIILIGVTIAVFAALWRFAKLPRSGVEMLVAALLIGIVGYVWQGEPNLSGSPLSAREELLRGDTAAMEARPIYVAAYDEDVAWFNFSEALIRSGATQEAVIAARSGIAKNPRSAALWVNLGNALVAHAEGSLTPPAKLAFQYAASLSPDDPAPQFYYGLALAESGRFEEAHKVWRALQAKTPSDARWRKDLESKLTALTMIIARGSASNPAPPAAR